MIRFHRLSPLAVALATLLGCSSGDDGSATDAPGATAPDAAGPAVAAPATPLPADPSAGLAADPAVGADAAGGQSAPEASTPDAPTGGEGEEVGADVAAGPDDAPFAAPDPAGASVVSRLGYHDASALADALVSADYLELFFDIENDLLVPITGSEGFFATAYEDRRVDCPDGGAAVLSSDAGAFSPVDIVFEGCTFEGRTLDGHYVREAAPNVFGSGGSIILTATLDGLSVDAGEAGRFRATGTSVREDGTSGFCPGLPSDFHTHEDVVASATVELAGRTFEIRDARSRDVLSHDQPGSPESCGTVIERRAFQGAATVRGDAFGAGDAALASTGEIARETPDDGGSAASASLSAAFADGSSVAVTLTDDAAGEAQFDVTADGTSSSFTDAYRFGVR